MSLVELKERLEIQKKMNNELNIEKRKENKLLIKEKNDKLISARNNIVKKNKDFNHFDKEKLNKNAAENKIIVNENIRDNEENPMLNKLENKNINNENNVKEAIPE